jgi:hypothetical protein
MNVLYIGDFKKKNGPSIIDINYRKELEEKEYNIKFIQSNDYKSIKEYFFRIHQYELLHISGISFLGILFMLIFKILNKKVVYLAHGTLMYEKKYSNTPRKRLFWEKLLIHFSDNVLTVSKLLKEKILKYYKIKEKIIIQYNGVFITNTIENIKKDKYTILAVGGGRKQKRILNICKAIENSKYKNNINFIVAGEDIEDSLEIKSYPFVSFVGFIKHSELNKLYKKSNIFILNSTFDSFSTSLFEAINNKCNIITSKYIGGNELFPISIKNTFEIKDDNLKNLKIRIDSLLEQPNNIKIYNFLYENQNKFSWRYRTEQLISTWIKIIDE